MEAKHLTPLKAIRGKCLDCVGGRPSLVRKCESFDCSLFCLRFGKNPNRKGCGTGFSKSSATRKADTAQVSEVKSASEGCGEAKLISSPGGAFNATIHRMNKSIVIKLTEL